MNHSLRQTVTNTVTLALADKLRQAKNAVQAALYQHKKQSIRLANDASESTNPNAPRTVLPTDHHTFNNPLASEDCTPVTPTTRPPLESRDVTLMQQSGPKFISAQHLHNGVQSSYKLYTPTAIDGKPVPLLLMLHGCSQGADDFATGTAMNVVAEKQGIAVLYPSQPTTSNMNKCWNWYMPEHQHRGAGEPDRLATLTRHICEDYSIDKQAIFVAGLSAGGSMALILAEQYPELFSAVGVHSGLATGAANDLPGALNAMKTGVQTEANKEHSSQPSDSPLHSTTATSEANAHSTAHNKASTTRYQPHIIFHGGEDRTVHASNANAIIDNCLRQVASPLDVSSNTRYLELPRHKAIVITTYHDAHTHRDICEHWHIPNAGHHWSGGNPAGTYTDHTGPDASEAMVTFFMNGMKQQDSLTHSKH